MFARFCFSAMFVPTAFWLVGAQEPKAKEAVKPQYERLLKGADAKKATELKVTRSN